MRKYEMMVILDQDISPVEQSKALVLEILKKNKANIKETKDIGLRELAYEIKEKSKGYYFQINYEVNQEYLDEISRLLKLNESVMRFINLVQEK